MFLSKTRMKRTKLDFTKKERKGKMKYVAKFELKNNSLKSDYRRVIVSYMKWAISNYMDGTFYDRLYESGSKKKVA